MTFYAVLALFIHSNTHHKHYGKPYEESLHSPIKADTITPSEVLA